MSTATGLHSTTTKTATQSGDARSMPVLTYVVNYEALSDDLITTLELRFPSGELVLGRRKGLHAEYHSASEVGIRDDLVSARHAILREQEGRITIEDSGSKNGTFLNGERLEHARVLFDGDWIEVGSSLLVYRDMPVELLRHIEEQPAASARLCAPAHIRSPSMISVVRGLVSLDASSAIVFRGEPGVGRATLARSVHREKAVDGAPLIEVRCDNLDGHPVTTKDIAGRLGRGTTVLLRDIEVLSLAQQDKLVAWMTEILRRAEGGSVRWMATTTLDSRRAGPLLREMVDRFDARLVDVPNMAARIEDTGSIRSCLARKMAIPNGALHPRDVRSALLTTAPDNFHGLARRLRALSVAPEEKGGRPGSRLGHVPGTRRASPRAARVVVCAARGDREALARLERHLSTQIRRGTVEVRDFRKVRAGDNERERFDAWLAEADVVLLLISASFLSSSDCWDDMQKAMRQKELAGTDVVAALLRDVDPRIPEFCGVRMLPSSGKPILRSADQERAWKEVSVELRRLVERRGRARGQTRW